eukprot:Nitzschia sp. Nitz4//scaffold69_size99277//8577//9152//NITZ4_004617-RA/size99277-processed-gene-0.72-mRNA-1//-1//CDS//3329556667//5711//frame0
MKRLSFQKPLILQVSTMKDALHLQKKVSATPESKHVSFAGKVSVRAVEHYHDYSIDEIEAYWYSEEEVRDIRKEMKTCIKMLEECSPEEMRSKCCNIGLEFYSKEGAKSRQKNRKRAWKSVMTEQSSQQAEGVQDPLAIADGYKKCAQSSRVVAAISARLLNDELEQSVTKRDTPTTCRRPSLLATTMRQR